MGFIKGVDIGSLLEELEAGARFYDFAGGESDEYKTEPEELLTILKRYDFDSVRIRLWNDPYSENGAKYGAGTNDLESALKMAKMAKEAGMSILFDFHYSDFWADPGKQTMPKAWRSLDAKELTKKVYDYTKEVMMALKNNGTIPEMVQVGNEVTNGLMWPFGKKPDSGNVKETNGEGYKKELINVDEKIGNPYDNIAAFISAGIKAVREVSPSTKIMIHLDNGGNNPMYRDWFDNYMGRIKSPANNGTIPGCPMNQKDMAVCGPVNFLDAEDFDVIGMSYYPFWHGTFEEFSFNMKDMAQRYGKPIIAAEVSMGFSDEDYRAYEKAPLEELKGMATKAELLDRLTYPMTKDGQCGFMKEFIDRIKEVNGGSGFYYWEPAWIPLPGVGWATEAALEYTGEKGPGGNEWANQALFDYDGRALPALRVIRDYK